MGGLLVGFAGEAELAARLGLQDRGLRIAGLHGFVGPGLPSDTYLQTWVPVRLPWAVLLANTAVLLLSTITIDLARRAITREAALAPIKSIPGVSLGNAACVADGGAEVWADKVSTNSRAPSKGASKANMRTQ